MKNKKLIIILSLVIFLAIAVLVVSLIVHITKSKSVSVNANEFVNISYEDEIEGRGKICADIDYNRLYNRLIEVSDESISRDLLRALSNSIECSVVGNNGYLKSGENIIIKLSFGAIDKYNLSSEEFSKIFGVNIEFKEFNYTIKQLQEDTTVYIDLWDYYKINISGIDGSGISYAERLFTDPIEIFNDDKTVKLIMSPNDQENVISIELISGDKYLLYSEAKLYCPKSSSVYFGAVENGISIGDHLKYYVDINIDDNILEENGFKIIWERDDYLVTVKDLGTPIDSAEKLIQQYHPDLVQLLSNLVKSSLSENGYKYWNFEKAFLRIPKNQSELSNRCYAVFSYYDDYFNKKYGYITLFNIYIDPEDNRLSCTDSKSKFVIALSTISSYDDAYSDFSDSLEHPNYLCTEIPVKTVITGFEEEYDLLESYSIRRIDGGFAISLRNNDLFGKIVIPESFDEIPIVCIDDNGFANCERITEVQLSQNITRIGEEAFASCMNLERIDINDCLEEIGEYAFSGCINLVDIEIPNTVRVLSRGVFENCQGLKSIKIPDSVTDIEYGAFSDCVSLESVIFGANVLNIEMYAFKNCASINFIHIPKSVTGIDNYSFENCSGIENIVIESTSNPPICGAFTNCNNIKNAIITTQWISDVNCKDTMTVINPDYDFNLPTQLLVKELFVNPGWEIIQEYTFLYCENLEKICLPITIKEIKQNAISDCPKLKEIVYNGTVKQWENIDIEDFWFDMNTLTIICTDGEIKY